jgi:hypothetical protein
MTVQCGWCGKVMGEKAPLADRETVSHGICPRCQDLLRVETILYWERDSRVTGEAHQVGVLNK